MAVNPNLQHLIVHEVKKALGKNDETVLSRYEYAKGAWRVRRKMRDFFSSSLYIILGILSAGFGLRGFLIPNSFIDGGVMGISLLINEKTGVSLSLLIIIINLPFLLLGWQQINKAFSIKSILAITALAIVVAFLPYPVVTNDKLLVAVFGGFFLGAGIGLTIRGGGVIDGTEILAIRR